MNGQISQMSNIVLSAREALLHNSQIRFEKETYIYSIKFVFVNGYTANSVKDWFDYAVRSGLQDIKFLIPIKVENRYTLGFSNTGNSSIVCFWNNGKVTYYYADWSVDTVSRTWNVIYREYEWVDPPMGKPVYSNPTEDFKNVLLDIEKFANKIKYSNFAKCFHSAYESLCGNISPVVQGNLSYIPAEFRNIYMAVAQSDVFGAMGSWNDEPPGMSQEMGLLDEYNRLSDLLLAQIRYSLMYITNECYRA